MTLLNICFIFTLCLYASLNTLISARTKVIIDADLGTDFDDTVALAYALARSDTFDIRLILMASFNTTGRAQLTAKFLHYVNRTDVDIGIGIHTPNYRELYNGVGAQMPWADDYHLSNYPGNIYNDGILRAKEILQSGSYNDPVYIIAIGPYTNIAQIFFDEPGLKQNARLIVMAGAIYKGYGTNFSEAEYNIRENGTSSQMVWNFNYTDSFPFSYDICAVPLDTSFFFQIYGNNYAKLLNSNAIIPKITLENFNVWYNNGGNTFHGYRTFNPLNATSIMYDLQTVYIAAILSEYSILNEKQMECNETFIPYMGMQRLPIYVNDTFYTVVDANSSFSQMVDLAMSWKEGDHNGSYKLGMEIVESLVSASKTDSGIEDWIIIVIVISAVVLLLIFVMLCVFWRRRKNDKSDFGHVAFKDELQNDQNNKKNYDAVTMMMTTAK